MAFKGLRFAAAEIRHASAGTVMKVVMAAISVIPLLYGGLYLAAFLDPYVNLNTVPVAVVNEDAGAEVDGEWRVVGDEVVDKLRDNDDGLGWNFVSADEAQAGLENGTYYMTCIIPEDFTETIASADSDSPEAAQLLINYNETKNMLASQIGGTVWKEVRTQVSDSVAEQYWDTVFGRVNDGSDQIQEAADGAGELRDGLNDAHDGSSEITENLGKLSEGAGDLDEGLTQLADGTKTLSDGAGTLVSGVNQLDDGAGQLAEGSTTLAEGTAKLHDEGTAEVAAGAAKLQEKGTSKVAEGASQLQEEGTSKVADGAAKLQSDGTSKVASGASQLQEEGTSKVADGASKLQEEGTSKVASGAATLQSEGTSKVAAGASKLQSEGTSKVAEGASKLQEEGTSKVASGAAQLQSEGTSVLAAGAEQLENQTSALPEQDKVEAAKAGSQQIENGFTGLKGGLNQLKGDAAKGTGLAYAAAATHQVSTSLSAAVADDGGVAQLSAGVNDLQGGTEAVETGLDKASAGLTKVLGLISGSSLTDAEKTQLTGALQLVQDAVDQSNGGLKTQVDPGLTKLAGGITQLKGDAATGSGLAYAAVATNQIASGLDTAVQSIGSSSDTGTTTLYGATNNLASGYSTLSSQLMPLVEGAPALKSAIAQISAGAKQVNEQMGTLASGASSLDTSAKELASGASSLDTSAKELVTGASTLDTSAKELATGASTLDSSAKELATGASTLDSSAKELASGASSLDTSAKELAKGAKSLNSSAKKLSKGADSLDESAGVLVKGANTINEKMAEVMSGAATLQDGADKLADGTGQLASKAPELADGTKRLADGAASAKDGSAQIVDGATKLHDGSAELTDGLVDAQEGADELADGLADGAEELHVDDPDAKAGVMSAPVQLHEEYFTTVKNYGTGFAPYFIALGLWVGALIAGFVLQPLNRRLVLSGGNPAMAAFSSYMPLALMSIVQAVLLLVMLQFGLQLQIDNVPGYYAFGILVGLVFAAFMQLLMAAFGFPGKFIAIILLMLQLTSSAGTFPIEQTPAFFQAVNPFMPMTYVVSGMRQIMTGFDTGVIATSVAVLAGIGIVSFLLTTLVARMKKIITMEDLHPLLHLG